MKNLTFLFLLWTSLVFSQSTSVTFDNLENVYTIAFQKSANDSVSIIITDSKTVGTARFFSLSEEATQSAFVEQVFSNIKQVTKEYFIKADKVTFKIPNSDDMAYANLQMIKPTDETILKEALKAKALYTDFTKYLDSIPDKGNKAFLKDHDTYKIYRDSNSYTFHYKKPLFEFKNEEDLYDQLYDKYEEITDGLTKVLLPEKTFNETIDFKLNEDHRKKLAEMFNRIKKTSDYSFLSNLSLSDTAGKIIGVFDVSIKHNNQQGFFQLKLCNESLSCKNTIKMQQRIQKDAFIKTLGDFIKTSFSLPSLDHTLLGNELSILYTQITSYNEKKVIEEATKPYKENISSLVEQIENLETKYSGKLKVNKSIRVYDSAYNIIPKKKFIVDYTTVRFFNNKAKEVVIVGQLNTNSEIEFVTLNVQFSFPLRAFNNTLHYVPISPNDEDAEKLFLNYNDLFQYYPYEGSYNYSARNKEYRIAADSTVNIEQRKLMDYFTAVIFSDILGLNDNNANSLLQAEGRIKMPLWIHNKGYFNFFHSVYADLNTTIYNGFDDNSRFITPMSVVADNTNPAQISSATINNFDYIKYNNVNAGLGINLMNIELKGLSTEWSFGLGFRYYRAGLRHKYISDQEDVIKTYQLNALSHELSTNFEIRPQLNFGMDINLAYNWLHSRGASDNLKIFFNEADGNNDKKVFRLQLNLYSKINPDESNGGIFARLGGFYHVGAKDFYPQILVGYATNLSSFVNRFKKKDE